MSHEHLGLVDTPPDRRQVLLGAAIVGLLYVVSIPILVVGGGVRLPEVGPFIPIVDAIMFVGEAITATLLYSQASVFRMQSLAILGTGYLYTALLLIPHALTFPGAFSRNGLFGDGANTTAWFAVVRYPAFGIAVMLYAQFKGSTPTAQLEERPAPNIGAHILAAILLATAAGVVAASGLLPRFALDRAAAIRSHVIEYQVGLTTLWVGAIVMLLRRRSSVLDLWLLVALAGWLLQSLLNMVEMGRFTAAWYWFYVITLFSHLVVMLALVAESTRLYGRLALSMSAWNREREARLTSIDALAAAISHEVGQPLSAAQMHQNAALKWLRGDTPNVRRSIKSLRAAIDADNLAIGVVKSIRATFARQTGARTQVGLADLVRATAPLLQNELSSAGISLTLALGEAPPPVLADRVQMQLVLINLLTNAIDALRRTDDRPRQIAIRLARLESRGVALEVSDNGVGMTPEDMGRIFDPFFTTKPTGTGLGLSLCRLIVEAHGGRLWASRGEAFGATFHVELPASA